MVTTKLIFMFGIFGSIFLSGYLIGSGDKILGLFSMALAIILILILMGLLVSMVKKNRGK